MTDRQEPHEVSMARVRLANAQDAARTTFTLASAQEVNDAWDAYDAAVRAETLREVRGVVEGMYLGVDATLARARVLDALDALAHPEGT